jgi:hypothetical protein
MNFCDGGDKNGNFFIKTVDILNITYNNKVQNGSENTSCIQATHILSIIIAL